MNKQLTKLMLSLGVCLTLVFATPCFGEIVVDDSFADGDRAATGPLQIDFHASSSSSAIESNAGSVGLVSGTSGRQIHGLFPTQTLALVGDVLTAVVEFVTPPTVSAGGTASGDDLRIGIFDHLGRNTPTQLDQDTSYSSSSPNPDYSGIPGYAIELDVEPSDPATDIQIRRSNPSTSGRLLGTNTGVSSLSSGPDIGYVFAPNTTYSLQVQIERMAAGELDITAIFLDSAGGVIGSHMDTDSSPNSYSFGMLGLGASTNAFGTSNSPLTPDNGIDITRVRIEFSTVPEPGTMSFLLGGLTLGLLRRRR